MLNEQERTKELAELEKLLGKKLPDDLNEIGMDYFSEEEFQQIFDFIEILMNVEQRIRDEKREEILRQCS